MNISNTSVSINKEKAQGCYLIEPVSTLNDILNSFETHFARSSKGWLCEKTNEATFHSPYTWLDKFSEAKAFPTLESAWEAIANAPKVPGHSILTTRSVFTQASRSGPVLDEITDAIDSAIQARDIGEAIKRRWICAYARSKNLPLDFDATSINNAIGAIALYPI